MRLCVLYLSAVLVSITLIVLGSLFAAPLSTPLPAVKWCRAEPLLPWYLIVAGCLTLLFVVVRIAVVRVSEKLGYSIGRRALSWKL